MAMDRITSRVVELGAVAGFWRGIFQGPVVDMFVLIAALRPGFVQVSDQILEHLRDQSMKPSLKFQRHPVMATTCRNSNLTNG